MLYYANRISENISRREPEGYLICLNVPIARTGAQEYLNDEVGKAGEGTVMLYRPEEEVFSKETMASFEGMPVTNDHPNTKNGVTKDNIGVYQKGHVQGVRRGTGKDRDLLIADLVITDPTTIQDVLDGKREVSCGYLYELCEENGKLVQRQIRGNHVAIVDEGRAGRRVCIKDSAPIKERSNPKMAKTKDKLLGLVTKMFPKWAMDASPEEVASATEVIDEAINDPVEQEEKPAMDETNEKLDTIVGLLEKKDKPETDNEPEELVVGEKVQTDGDKLDTLIDLLTKVLEKGALDCKGKDEEPEVDPLDKLEADLDEIEKAEENGELQDADEELPEEEEEFAPDEDPTEPESQFVDPEEINEQDEDEVIDPEEKAVGTDKLARDAMRKAIKAMRPIIAQMPPSQRKAASDAAVASIRESYGMTRKPNKNGYLELKNRRRSFDSKKKTASDDAALAERIMKSRNVNYKK